MGAIDASEAVLAANRRFYEAFEARSMDAMSDVWERSDRSTCTHPGWATLRGWGPIASSFFALFQGPRQIQFVLTEERAEVVGDLAWVSVDENLLGDQGGATISAVNIFVRRRSVMGPGAGSGPEMGAGTGLGTGSEAHMGKGGRAGGRAGTDAGGPGPADEGGWRLVCHHGSIVNHSIVTEPPDDR